MSERKSPLKVNRANSKEELVQVLANLLKRCSQEALARQDKFSVGLSGKDRDRGQKCQVTGLLISPT